MKRFALLLLLPLLSSPAGAQPRELIEGLCGKYNNTYLMTIRGQLVRADCKIIEQLATGLMKDTPQNLVKLTTELAELSSRTEQRDFGALVANSAELRGKCRPGPGAPPKEYNCALGPNLTGQFQLSAQGVAESLRIDLNLETHLRHVYAQHGVTDMGDAFYALTGEVLSYAIGASTPGRMRSTVDRRVLSLQLPLASAR
jgi:hypothetical protein